MKKISLIVPCFNEGDNVLPFFQAATEALSHLEMLAEFIFVNDGSRDDTLVNLRKLLAHTSPEVIIIDFSRNFGKEAAMYAGLEKANGDYAVIIDADLQQDPNLIPPMLEFLKTHLDYDSVAYYQEARNEPFLLRSFKKAFYHFINGLSPYTFYPGASDFRLMNRKMIDSIISLKERNRFSKGIFSWIGFKTHYLPYDADERRNGQTSWSFWKLFRYAVDGITSFSDFPLRIATLLGILFSLLSLMYLIVVIIQKIFFHVEIEGYPTIVCLILLLGGVQLLVLGIIGEYLSKIHSEIKKRPLYIAKNIWKNAPDDQVLE